MYKYKVVKYDERILDIWERMYVRMLEYRLKKIYN
jgi:hypothetical protein